MDSASLLLPPGKRFYDQFPFLSQFAASDFIDLDVCPFCIVGCSEVFCRPSVSTCHTKHNSKDFAIDPRSHLDISDTSFQRVTIPATFMFRSSLNPVVPTPTTNISVPTHPNTFNKLAITMRSTSGYADPTVASSSSDVCAAVPAAGFVTPVASSSSAQATAVLQTTAAYVNDYKPVTFIACTTSRFSPQTPSDADATDQIEQSAKKKKKRVYKFNDEIGPARSARRCKGCKSHKCAGRWNVQQCKKNFALQ
ncbi:hypothetical protein BDR26DRAFT_970381 [Obelidium mucronatum]|nr:hypothetical protein BDR26DRAFT_970381 [Obelidium mucronatum]